MSGIDEYLQRIQHLINELPFKLSATINKKKYLKKSYWKLLISLKKL